jgi:hypothetical protein
MTSFHATERAMIEARLIPIATTTHSQRTFVKAWPTVPQSGP